MSDTTATIRIGPDDHGRPMTLDEFREAAGTPGYSYELAEGVIQAVQIPGGSDAAVLAVIQRKLARYWDDNLERIELIAGGSSCRLESLAMRSERHPDCAVYLTPRPVEDPPWGHWIPDIVVEVVSQGGEERDYREKRDDYIVLGVQEYWIVDPQKKTMLALTRQGSAWSERMLDSGSMYQTRLLPGFELSMAEVFRPLERGGK